MSTYNDLLRQIDLDRSDVFALFTYVTGLNRAWLIAHGTDDLSPVHWALLEPIMARRKQGEPIAYITGYRDFFGYEFKVDTSVLIPRPETELLVELAQSFSPPDGKILDLGTGSGCIAVTLKCERPDLEVVAVDCSSDSLQIASFNAKRLGATVYFLESNWFSALGGMTFDLIVSNPPYIALNDPHLLEGDLRFEPRHALSDGADGFTHLRTVVNTALSFLRPGGWLLFEHGWDQALMSRNLLTMAGFDQVSTWNDLAGLERVSGGRKRCAAVSHMRTWSDKNKMI